MSSIVRDGHTFHGTSACGRGVFQLTKLGITYVYAGQIRNNSACGLGVLTRSCGKAFAEYDPDGKIDGRFVYVSHDAKGPGGLAGYILFEHGEFVATELTTYSVDAVLRAIPSVVDGLKPSQRKVLWTTRRAGSARCRSRGVLIFFAPTQKENSKKNRK